MFYRYIDVGLKNIETQFVCRDAMHCVSTFLYMFESFYPTIATAFSMACLMPAGFFPPAEAKKG